MQNIQGKNLTLLVMTILFVQYSTQSSTKQVSIFGSDWYGSDLDKTGTPKYTNDEFEWEIPHTHCENIGFVTHFDKIKLEEGVKYEFKMGWKSYGKKTDCSSKYWTESKYLYQCTDPKTEDPVDGCNEEVRCLVNTGDFRIVLADSNGHKVSKNNFGSLDSDKTTGEWQGVHWRMFPHTGDDLTHVSPAIPCSIYFKEDYNKNIFATDNMKREEIFHGCFDMPENEDNYLTLTIKKSSDRQLWTRIEMNGKGYDKTHTLSSTKLVPQSIDTFAFSEPNLRGYEYLKIWEIKSTQESFLE